MIALDTNVLVRFLVEDDAEQSALAKGLIEAATAAGEACFLSDIVLCETVWVLTRSYKRPRAEIVQVLRGLLRARQMRFSSTERLLRAVGSFEHGRGDFADYLIREQATDAGCRTVVTFDRALLAEDGFRQP